MKTGDASETSEQAALQQLGLAPPRRFPRWAIVLLLLALGGGIAVALSARGRGDRPRYRTEPVSRGDLLVTVTATGTLQGRDTVEIGAELSGRVAQVLVEPNATVRAGQVLAVLDTSQLDARLEESVAQVRSADAAVLNAEATAAEARQKAERARTLSEKGLLSRQELEAAEAAATRAQAQVATSLAQRTVSRASERSARLARAKAEIIAPIDGVVLARQVEPGQTVVAAMQAPVLFVLARDLTRMVLRVQVDEADVGRVAIGQSATFTVDAYPGRSFAAEVLSVRLYPTTSATTSAATSTVVTYEAELSVQNPDLALRPGMTATATIATETRKAVLRVPSAALRFTPPSARQPRGGMFFFPGLPGGRGPPDKPKERPSGAVVWTLRGEEVVSVPVEPGAADGSFTELRKGALEEGQPVLVGLEEGPR